jgi:hypothetical protein
VVNLDSDDLLWVVRRQHVGQGLVSADQIFLDGHVVLDLEEDDRGGDYEREAKQGEGAGVFGKVGDSFAVERPDDGGTGRLNAFVETDVVGRAATGVGERTHEPGERWNGFVKRGRGGEGRGDLPVDAGLPESIVQAVEEVEEHWPHVAGGGPVGGNEA